MSPKKPRPNNRVITISVDLIHLLDLLQAAEQQMEGFRTIVTKIPPELLPDPIKKQIPSYLMLREAVISTHRQLVDLEREGILDKKEVDEAFIFRLTEVRTKQWEEAKEILSEQDVEDFPEMVQDLIRRAKKRIEGGEEIE